MLFAVNFFRKQDFFSHFQILFGNVIFEKKTVRKKFPSTEDAKKDRVVFPHLFLSVFPKENKEKRVVL